MTARRSTQLGDLPGSDFETAKMPAHWLRARFGKRAPRPGGLGMTQTVLDRLSIAPSHGVVGIAPGLGVSARIITVRKPRCRVGAESEPSAMRSITRLLPRQPNVFVVLSSAEETTLAANSSSVVLGEAILRTPAKITGGLASSLTSGK